MTLSSTISVQSPLLVHSDERGMNSGQSRSIRTLQTNEKCAHKLKGSLSEPMSAHTSARTKGNYDGQHPVRASKTKQSRPVFDPVRRPGTDACPQSSRRHPNGSSHQAAHVVERYPGDGTITSRSSMIKPPTKLYFETCQDGACEPPSAFDVRLRMRPMDVLPGAHQAGCLR